MAQVRVMKGCLEESVKSKIDPGHPIVKWLIEYAATVISRYRVGSDGRTAYERVRGKQCTKTVTTFGEKTYYINVTIDKESKEATEAKWEYGLWLGVHVRSNENIIATNDGVIRRRTVKRMREDLRWDAMAINGLTGVSWDWKRQTERYTRVRR